MLGAVIQGPTAAPVTEALLKGRKDVHRYVLPSAL